MVRPPEDSPQGPVGMNWTWRKSCDGERQSMRLKEIVKNIEEVDNKMVIVVARGAPVTGETEANLVEYSRDFKCPDGMRYFLEADIAREAISVWSEWRAGAKPTLEEAIAAVIYYAERDAYLPCDSD